MKLYTEEQVRKAIMIAENQKIDFTTIVREHLTPIELPSDEELHHLSPGYKHETDYDIGFLHGWNTGVKVYYDRILNKTI